MIKIILSIIICVASFGGGAYLLDSVVSENPQNLEISEESTPNKDNPKVIIKAENPQKPKQEG